MYAKLLAEVQIPLPKEAKMEKVTRMNGLSENLVIALLNLIRMVVEGKILVLFMVELKTFLNHFTEKVKFYQFMGKKHFLLLREYEKFFEVLWDNKSHKSITHGKYAIMQCLSQYPKINAWKTVSVEVDRNWTPEMIDNSDLLYYEYILLMSEGKIGNWKEPGQKVGDLIEILKDHGDCASRYDHVVRFDVDEEECQLQLTFFELSY